MANNCWVCCQPVKLGRQNTLKIPKDVGTSFNDAFPKICELLKVPYSELQLQEGWCGWRKEEGKLPFCSSCLNDLDLIVKLQEQLKALQKKIDDRIGSIREKLRRVELDSSPFSPTEVLIANLFRSKALGYNATSTISSPVGEIFKTTSTTYSSANFLEKPLSSCPTQDSVFNPPEANSTSSSQQLVHIDSTPNSILPPPSWPPVDENRGQDNADDFDDGAASEYHDEDNSTDDDEQQTSNPTVKHEHPPKRIKRQRMELGVNVSTKATNVTTQRRILGGNDTAETKRKQGRSAEYFSPTYTDGMGRMVFEGITITPTRNGYKCGQCGATCGKAEDSLSLRKTKIHIKGFHLGAYTCPICDKNFSSNDILNQHVARFHNTPKSPCPDCGKPIKKKYLLNHQYLHMNAEEKAACVAAGFKPADNSKYLSEATFPCRICEKMFVTSGRLRRHEASHIDPEFRKDFKCHLCDRGYTTEQARKEHVFLVHENTARKILCKVCGLTVYHKSLQKHMKKHAHTGTGPYQCSKCSTTVANRRGLTLHEAHCKKIQKKTEDHKFQCDICDKYFKTMKVLRGHRRKVHQLHWKNKVPGYLAQDVSVDPPGMESVDDLNNEGIQHVNGNTYAYQLYQVEKFTHANGKGAYRCSTCSEEIFLDPGSEAMNSIVLEEDLLDEMVKSHIKSQHLGSFRCNLCSKRMKNLSEVQAHQRTEHFKLKGHSCDICGRKAIPSKAIKKHLFLHKNAWEMVDAVNAGESLPSSYPGCGSISILKEMGIEVSIKCAICDKTCFEKVEDLFAHRRQEHPDAPLLKGVPGSTPVKPGRKKRPDVPTDCPHCGKTCKSSKAMYSHVYKVHKKRKQGGIRRKRKGNSNTQKRKMPCKKEEKEDVASDSEDEIEIKEEVLTPDNSDDEAGGEYNEDENIYSSSKCVDETAVSEESNDRRRSLRDRSSLRRSASHKNFNYKEEQEEEVEEEDSAFKMSPSSSSDSDYSE